MERTELHEATAAKFKWLPLLAERYFPVDRLIDWVYDLALEEAAKACSLREGQHFGRGCACGSREVQQQANYLTKEREAAACAIDIRGLKL